MKSIIIISVLTAVIVTMLNLYGYFNKVDKDKINLMKSFGATKLQILTNLMLPSSKEYIISSLKVNIGLCWTGVIIGELQVGKQGLGYLISYGSQVFQLDIVIAAIVILTVTSYAIYCTVNYFSTK